MSTWQISSTFWRGFLAAWFLGNLILAVLGPTAAGAAPAGSRRIAVLGARSDLLRFLSAPLPSIPGATLENLSSGDITPARLAQYDTLALLELCNVTPPLNAGQLDAVEEWIKTGGGKLLIWDSDRCVPSVDYRFLSYPFSTNNPGAQGNHSGTLDLLVDSPLGSSDPTSPAYVDMASLEHDTDSGDTNVMVTHAAEWCAVISTTNLSGAVGASEAYAYAGKGLMLYAGFDLDYLGSNPQLNQLWQRQLTLEADREKGTPIPGLSAGPGCPQPVIGLGHVSGLMRHVRNLGENLMQIILFVLPVLVLIFGFLILFKRNELVAFIRQLLRLLAGPALLLAFGLEPLLGALAWQVRSVFHASRQGLGWATAKLAADDALWPAWFVIGPFFYLVLFLIETITDFLIEAPKLAVMLGVDYVPPALPVDLGSLTGVIYIATGLTYAAPLTELLLNLPIRGPWHEVEGKTRAWLIRICFVGFTLTALDYLMFNWFAALITPQVGFNPTLGSILIQIVLPLLGVLLLGATCLTGWALWIGHGALLGLALFFALLAGVISWLALWVTSWLFELARLAATAFIDMPAVFGKKTWNATFLPPDVKDEAKVEAGLVYHTWIFGLYKTPLMWVDPEPITVGLELSFLRRIFEILRFGKIEPEVTVQAQSTESSLNGDLLKQILEILRSKEPSGDAPETAEHAPIVEEEPAGKEVSAESIVPSPNGHDPEAEWVFANAPWGEPHAS